MARQKNPFEFEFQDYPEVISGGFNPRSVGAQPVRMGNIPAPSYVSPYKAMFESIQPQPTPGLDKYRDLVSNVPQMQNYQPSKWRRFGAAVAGGLAGAGSRNAGAGYELGRTIAEQPYQNALEGWKIQESGLRQAATREVEDAKAQNQYLKNIFDLWTKDEATRAGITRTGMTTQASRDVAGIRGATAENVAALTNATRKELAEIHRLEAGETAASRERIGEAANTSREKVGAGRNAATLGAAGIRADATRYTADRGVEEAEIRGTTGGGRKSIPAAVVKEMKQQFLLSKMSSHSSLYSDYGPIQQRIGTGGNPTGEFIMAQTAEEVDDEFKSDYFQLLAEWRDHLQQAEERLNAPVDNRLRIPAPPKSNTPTIPSVRTVNPPGAKSSSSSGPQTITLPSGAKVTVRKK